MNLRIVLSENRFRFSGRCGSNFERGDRLERQRAANPQLQQL
ncbi:hypothetical protein SAMCCGM7_pC2158 (plasmid) [Sinorhizobium americanum CCGM7]|nr:hypothetical protein SAMCCGM7_pC2158 [Sinorhizobium americanum CCGM7]